MTFDNYDLDLNNQIVNDNTRYPAGVSNSDFSDYNRSDPRYYLITWEGTKEYLGDGDVPDPDIYHVFVPDNKNSQGLGTERYVRKENLLDFFSIEWGIELRDDKSALILARDLVEDFEPVTTLDYVGVELEGNDA